jgi:hypothetical protein
MFGTEEAVAVRKECFADFVTLCIVASQPIRSRQVEARMETTVVYRAE